VVSLREGAAEPALAHRQGDYSALA
jgi:hypothetical protein